MMSEIVMPSATKRRDTPFIMPILLFLLIFLISLL